LPATTQVEHWDIHNSYGHTDMVLNRPAIAPMGEAKTNTQIFRELSLRMGLHNPLLQEDDESLCRLALQNPRNLQSASPVTWDALLKDGFAHWPVADAPFAHGGFPGSSVCKGRARPHVARVPAHQRGGFRRAQHAAGCG
jgi:anaerobic selenocysteine-containing dehydrogenase